MVRGGWRGRDGPTGRDGGTGRPAACLHSLAFRLSPRRAGGRGAPGSQFKGAGSIDQAGEKDPAPQKRDSLPLLPPTPLIQHVTFFHSEERRIRKFSLGKVLAAAVPRLDGAGGSETPGQTEVLGRRANSSLTGSRVEFSCIKEKKKNAGYGILKK